MIESSLFIHLHAGGPNPPTVQPSSTTSMGVASMDMNSSSVSPTTSPPPSTPPPSSNRSNTLVIVIGVIAALLAAILTVTLILYILYKRRSCYRKGCYTACIHVLMRDEKEGRKKQTKSNKQQGKATQHTQGNHFS